MDSADPFARHRTYRLCVAEYRTNRRELHFPTLIGERISRYSFCKSSQFNIHDHLWFYPLWGRHLFRRLYDRNQSYCTAEVSSS